MLHFTIILRYISLQALRPPVGHGAATMSLLHWALSFVKACSCPHVNPNSFSYILHVVLGLPRFFFPGGVHLKATLSIRTCGIRRTWSNYLSRRFLTSRSMLAHLVSCTGRRERFCFPNRCCNSSVSSCYEKHLVCSRQSQQFSNDTDFGLEVVLFRLPDVLESTKWAPCSLKPMSFCALLCALITPPRYVTALVDHVIFGTNKLDRK